jgi:hypothetical protein
MNAVLRATLCGCIVVSVTAVTADDLEWRRPEAARANARAAAKARAKSEDKKTNASRESNQQESNSPAPLRESATDESKPIARQAAANRGEIQLDPFGEEAGFEGAQIASQPRRAPRRANRQVVYHGPAYTPPWHPHPLYSWHQGAFPGPPSHAAGPRWQRGPHGPNGYVVSQPGTAELVPPGPSIEPEPLGDDPLGGWGDNCGGCGNCDACGPAMCGPYCPWPPIFHVSAMLGVQSFKGPVDNGVNGNFGFSQGFNLAAPLPLFHYHPLCHNIGMQFGMRFVQSNLNGHFADGNFNDDPREQMFVTAGLFKRANEHSPWQYGIAYDWMHDDYFYQADVSQLRLEVSRFGWCGNEVGIMAAFRAGDDNVVLPQQSFTLEANDYYAVFLRRALACDGEWKVYAGPTGNGDGMLGAEVWLPVSDTFALEGGATYVFAKEGQPTAQSQDSYAIGLNLIWYPYRRARCAAGSPFRPLIDVADNGNFFLERQ